ncbi:MrcB family domain-containing protein [Lysobacter silvisoli]|nr:DUF3578 domain-containing protein [Lysobacter silvisoli]
MDLRSAVAEVIGLQALYSSSNTDDMKRRGALIRKAIPNALSQIQPLLAESAGVEIGDLLIEGRDATGMKAQIPWVRFGSRKASPRATVGWYVVLLFGQAGAGAYLALAHGSTQFRHGAFVPRSDEELSQLMAWGRARLSRSLPNDPRLVPNVKLGSVGALARSYEKSCVVAYQYSAAELPDDAGLQRDMTTLAGLLRQLYDAERLGQTPSATDPSVRDAEEAGAVISRPTSTQGGQGFALSADERRAIELRAMRLATTRLQELGFRVEDVSKMGSFDLLATRGDETVRVEVKGTTGNLGAILLTANEVQLHLKAYPANALMVVHGIELVERDGSPLAVGGTLQSWMPWALDIDLLKGITFKYQLA